MPEVSVLMPVYNGERFLREAVESILHQTFSDFEFIILDDGSSDHTISILDEYARRDGRMILVRNETNMGIARSLNRGLALAQGEYIARMDADDISLPGRLAAQVTYLNSHPDVGVLGTAVRLTDPEGMLGQEIRFPVDHTLLRWRLSFFENPIIHPTIMMSKTKALMVNGYDPDKEPSEDHDIWCRLSGLTRLANLSEVYLYFRKHEDSISSKRAARQQVKSLENSRQLLYRLLGEDIAGINLQRACHAVWSPAEAGSQDYVQLAHLKYRLGNVLLTDPDASLMEHESLKKMILGELARLNSHVKRGSDHKEFQYWMQSIQETNPQSEVKRSNQTGKQVEDFVALQCPRHNSPLNRDGSGYHCEHGCFYPINNVAQFVSPGNISNELDNRWKNYQKMRIDSSLGKDIFRHRLTRLMGGNLDILNNLLVLEVGCGVGGFSENLSQNGARVLAADRSSVVELNYENCHNYGYYAVIQADLHRLPVVPEQFDLVIGIGVIQHTPSPENAIKLLCGYLKPGGQLIIDLPSNKVPITASRKVLRNMLNLLPHVLTTGFCRILVATLWPFHRLLWKYRGNSFIKRLRSRFLVWSPVVDSRDSYAELWNDLLYAWAMVDTHTTLTEDYYHMRSAEEIETALRAAGMEDIKTACADDCVEAWARRPLLTE